MVAAVESLNLPDVSTDRTADEVSRLGVNNVYIGPQTTFSSLASRSQPGEEHFIGTGWDDVTNIPRQVRLE